MKKFLIALVCVLCIIPTCLFASGKLTLKRTGGFSTMGVIIGPIVGVDDILNPGVVVSGPAADYSSSNLSPNTPYTNGALRAYSNLGVYNVVRDSKTWNGFKYASFIRFFRIMRNDGRVIYDDDGIIDVSADRTKLADEVVNYPSFIYSIETKLPIKSGAGFLWTNQQAKFKSGGELICAFYFSNSSSTGSSQYIYDLPVNPTDKTRNLATIMFDKTYNGSAKTYDCLAVNLNATGQYENTFWGNTGGDVSVSANLTNFIAISERDWTNELTSSATSGYYNGRTAYYSPKNFTVVARNLNNYVKINGTQATPQYGTSVVPFRDGHHIEISEEGLTLVEIENGNEGIYTPYYCFVDTTLPDVSYTYHNANALENRKVGMINTNANGAKSQTINEGVFKDQVQVNFSADLSVESPETATYTFNGQTYPLTSGTWLNEEGSYTITIVDKAGNTTISKFAIDKTAPNYNVNRLENDTNYKVAKWYLTDIPYGYTGYGSYSFADYNDALSFAFNIEKQNNVTEYTLNNIDDFTNTHLVANGNVVKTGQYWYYKSKDSPNLYVYYFDENSLNEAVNYYAKGFVSNEQVFKLNTLLATNNYGNTIDKSIYYNLVNINDINAYIINDFTFRYLDDTETYKIYYDYQEDDQENWKELVYNVPFSQQVNSHGLYKIREVDFVGNETVYYVYLDLSAPMLDIEAKIYGKDKIINETISNNDIPVNGELIYYYESFKITNVIEDYKWWVMEIICPDKTVKRYTYLDEIPTLESLGSGEFTITISDRVDNDFKFKVCILGKAPTVDFKTINANSQLQVSISSGADFNTLTDLKIYRNGVCLNSESGYDENLLDEANEIIFIDVSTLKYVFNKGGIYVVELTDNFGRTLSYEHKFEKDLPTGNLVGVEHNGKTKDEVKFIYDSNKYFVIVTEDNQNFSAVETLTDNIMTLTFTPKENSEHFYNIKLVDKVDNENYNIYAFTSKTIKPIINLYGVENGGTTGGNVYALWETNEEQYNAFFTLSGTQQEYKKGQILSVEGKYTILLRDEIGNESSVNFVIDKTIDFLIADTSGNIYEIEQIKCINFDIRIIEQEPLTITVTKNNSPYEYEFGLMITEEGSYLIKLLDEFGNSFFFSFEIDKTPPVATLYGVENYGVTNGRAWIASLESNLTSWYVLNGVYTNSYKLGTELKQAGKYKVFVADVAKNYVSFEFEIDNAVSYDINTYRGGISNGGVRIIAGENLRIVMLKDGQKIDYNFEQILKDDGEYSFTLVDDLGNKTSSFFTIITKKKQNLNHILQEDIELTSITKNDEDFDFEIKDRNLYLFDEGTYKVKVLDCKTNKEFSFEITLDTTPPTLELVGVENGGSTKKTVSMKNVSESPYDLLVYVDGIKYDYKIGEEIEKSGQFEVILTDEAGNSTTYTFERIYSLNGPSIAVLAGLGALVVLVIILIVKSRQHYYKDEIIEEDIEEETDETESEDDDNQE